MFFHSYDVKCTATFFRFTVYLASAEIARHSLHLIRLPGDLYSTAVNGGACAMFRVTIDGRVASDVRGESASTVEPRHVMSQVWPTQLDGRRALLTTLAKVAVQSLGQTSRGNHPYIWIPKLPPGPKPA